MACERYKTDLIDAALGTLETRRDDELHAHLVNCPACRAALEAERRLLAAIDDGIAASVAAEPSPEFAARVRRRLEQETMRGRPWLAAWIPATAGALAILALVAVWFARREATGSGTRPSTQTTVARRQQTPDRETAAQQSTGPPSLAIQSGYGGPERPSRTRARQGPWRRPGLPGQAEILISPGERAGVLRLYDALRSGRVDAASLPAERTPLGLTELKIAPLELAAIGLEWKEPPSDKAR